MSAVNALDSVCAEAPEPSLHISISKAAISVRRDPVIQLPGQAVASAAIERETQPVKIAVHFLNDAHLLGSNAVATLARRIDEIGSDEIAMLVTSPWRIRRLRELGFGWGTISMPMLEHAGVRGVDAQLEMLARIHDRIRAE
jgi:hypothetical protein